MVSDKITLAIALFLVGIACAQAQRMDDASDSVIGPANTRIVLDLIRERFHEFDPKVSSLRKAEGSWICGSVNVKNRDGIYSGERGFIIDVADRSFGRVPDGPEMLSPRSEGFQEKERIRQLYFKMCLEHAYN